MLAEQITALISVACRTNNRVSAFVFFVSSKQKVSKSKLSLQKRQSDEEIFNVADSIDGSDQAELCLEDSIKSLWHRSIIVLVRILIEMVIVELLRFLLENILETRLFQQKWISHPDNAT